MLDKFQLGLEVLLKDKELKAQLKGKRVALIGHPASTDCELTHSLDLLMNDPEIYLVAGFGPQHGMKGEKQYNMEESSDYIHEKYEIPIFSLYGDVRHPSKKMMESFDVVLFDLQDIGCRIYTYLTSLVYMLEACNEYQDKALWVLDRPNPAGRNVEGSYLLPNLESFVGAAPLLMRHGLTSGEIANWYKQKKNLDNLDLKVVRMSNYNPNEASSYGWPDGDLPWVNPSPNIPNLASTKMFSGTVLLEGTRISEGRGTTIPLQVFGAPELDAESIYREMVEIKEDWLKGCYLRTCFFEPTFNKHQGVNCSGIQIHLDHKYLLHSEFRPYRLMAVYFRAIRNLYPSYEIWHSFHYEYEKEKMPIDMLTGSSFYREWVDNQDATFEELDTFLLSEEQLWLEERADFLLY
ncbi:MAG: DUF1343 domain-containing protein [Bdellovibrionaceae bacterium]|nr:DUF1343 domain-containing protein [Pseudobdellovibrionaceae bacterium]